MTYRLVDIKEFLGLIVAGQRKHFCCCAVIRSGSDAHARVPMTFDPSVAARFIADAHRTRATYRNLPTEMAPTTIDEAYAAQDALAQMWQATEGPVAGLKIATTTKVMQQLMGIDHPCGGLIFARRIHATPAKIERAKFVHLVVECELAVRIGRDLPLRETPYSRGDVRAAVGAVMPAFELIEDRNAVYKETRAVSLIADNAWNGGIVLGPETVPSVDLELNGLVGRLDANGVERGQGKTDDPMGALAWVANLGAKRGWPLKAGMVVITGSVIPTLPIGADERFSFGISDFGRVEMTAA
jgi:2-keto-4-pentenoate hydratase